MAVKVGDGPAARRYKAMLAADAAKKSAKPAAKKAAPPAAKPKGIIARIQARKKALRDSSR